MEELNEFTSSVIKRMLDSEQKYKNHLDGVAAQLKAVVNNFVKKETNIEKTPKQNKKRPKRLSPIISEVTLNETDIVDSGRESTGSTGSLRPVRTTRGNAKCYKEVPLNVKMRRDVNEISITVKKERISEIGPKPITISKVQSLTSFNDNKEKQQSKRSSSNSENQEEAKKLNNSDVEILPNTEIGIIELDDENDKMPPPSIIPPTKKAPKITRQTRTNSQESSQETETETGSIEIKEESEMPPPKQRGRPRTKRTKKTTELTTATTATVVKEEKKSLPKTIENEISEEIIESPPIISRKTKTPSPAKSIANTTIESIYEDAVGEGNTDSKMFKSQIVITTTASSSKASEETFVCSTSDMTFDLTTKQSSDVNETVVITKKKNSNETFCVPSSIVNETVVIESNKKFQKKESISSLISEDLSDEDEEEFIEPSPEIIKKPKKKNKNEVFNPFEQSPVKKKVEAFEKHVFNTASPVPQRVTRTKTKAKAEKENIAVETDTTTKIPKYGTPTHQQPYVAPAFLSQNNKKVLSSASKLAHISKSATIKPSASGRTTPSHSRDASVEDTRRGLQLLAEEKKKKREEKQKQAQLQRDLKEKEKREQTERLAKEKDDKCKRLMQEKDLAREKAAKERKDRELEHKRILDEQKRAEEMRKLELKKREERELAERREREYYEQMKAAQEETSKKLMSNKLAQQAKILAITKQKKQAVINLFDYLESGDSTEEEGKVSTKKPPPPKWSSGSKRDEAMELQNYMNISVIDNYFSVQPLTPDLSEIFPTIHVKYLKRNSSAVWNTPPRYSQMPKY